MGLAESAAEYRELVKNSGEIDLVAVYRNHDFLNKTLGNYIGLGSFLLSFRPNQVKSQEESSAIRCVLTARNPSGLRT
jgi:hypothetical protein